MCGIIGFIGIGDGIGSVTDGLEKLEYRGYDSAGLCFAKNGSISAVKAVGHVEVLKRKVFGLNLPDDCGVCIGHTRWATHGEVSELNTHPHQPQIQKKPLRKHLNI